MALPCTVSTCRPWPLIFACLEPAQRNFEISHWRCTKVESDTMLVLILSTWMWGASDIGSTSRPMLGESVAGIWVAFCEHSFQRYVMPINVLEEVDFIFVVHDCRAVKN